MTPDESEVDALLESLTRNQPVDWERVEGRAATEEQRTRVRAFRDVARIADFHRTLQRDVAPQQPAREVERWGDLLLLERVGSGATGDVYRAWDPALQREVALKLLRVREDERDDARSFLEEARSLARVRDPHVVSVFGAGEHDGRPGIWMEFLRGPTLESEIARRGPLAPEEVAGLGAQLGQALAAAHGAGSLHRDIKPANVILEPDGRAVLMDFGLGHRRFSGDGDPRPFSGTPMFMSPQRLAGSSATASDDLYALGVTLRWALAGTPPYSARTVDELRDAIAAGALLSLRAVRRDAPEALVVAIERAMATEPAARFEHAATLVATFQALRGQPPAPVPSRWRVGAGTWLATATTVAVLASLLAITRLPRHESARPTPPIPPPVVSNAYDVSGTLLKRSGSGDTRLDSGDRVAPGDQLSLEFRATRSVWVYVLDADERGESYLLFPQPFFDRRNPLPGDSTLLLPGARGGHENAWTVTSRGGREHFLVVASPAPVPELEAELSNLSAPIPGRPVSYTRVESGTMERLRGVGGVSELPHAASRSGPGALFERIRSLAGGEQGVHGTWVRQVTLENPLR